MNILTKIKNDQILNNLSSFFDNKIYLVGGAIRDILLGKEIVDRDLIVTDEDAKDFAIKVAEFFGGKFIPLDEKNKIYRVVLKDKINYIDITNPVENSLDKDIFRRDLTINAICADIRTGEIYDPACGLRDFKNKLIKGISEDNFTDDPLRLLRIFRFYAILGFEISEDLMNTAKKHAQLIKKTAKERIENEIMKLFNGDFAHSAILKMDEAGILELIFPFVIDLKKVPPNSHHHLDLFHHSVETVRQIGIIYKNSTKEVQNHLNKVDFGGFPRISHLRLAGFMHDIGKFSTWTIEEATGRHRFIKHDDVGAQMCSEILKSVAFSNKQINYIKTMIKNHIYPSMVVYAPDLTDKVKMRFVRKAGENAIDMITLAKADRLSALGKDITKKIVEDNISRLNNLQDFYLKSLETLIPLPKLLDGNEIMKLLDIKPSKYLGEILNSLHQAQLDGEVTTYEQAVKFVKSF
ncbi:CCA tRNA nucleotidyltransferase [bacterium]|nr:CCA tRNA nucleotidyltransferase [bacterium]